MRNIDGIFNYKEPIEHTVEVELFYRRHKKRIEVDVIGGQKWRIYLLSRIKREEVQKFLKNQLRKRYI